ncbi:Recombination protein RecR [hydrothermal vent metagenome]|uniref:Recombination protein RecR n=1 Tax=hydrothermal vent metagenome TaxID=652676 RepID=A0A3B1E681_9ZZZZ
MYKKSLENFYELVESFESLPTIGRKSALRLAYYIVNENSYTGLKIAHSIENVIKNIKQCIKCNCISENEICEICLDEHRDQNFIAIVQSAKDIFAIEESGHFNGTYFVLENIESYTINKLIALIEEKEIKEILFAITPSLANDTFILYVEDKLKFFTINFTKIAQGIPTGVSLENIDILSLACAIDGKQKI